MPKAGEISKYLRRIMRGVTPESPCGSLRRKRMSLGTEISQVGQRLGIFPPTPDESVEDIVGQLR